MLFGNEMTVKTGVYRVLLTVYLPYMRSLIEKQSVGVFVQYFYDIFSVPGSVLGVQSYKHRLTVHLPTTAQSMH